MFDQISIQSLQSNHWICRLNRGWFGSIEQRSIRYSITWTDSLPAHAKPRINWFLLFRWLISSHILWSSDQLHWSNYYWHMLNQGSNYHQYSDDPYSFCIIWSGSGWSGDHSIHSSYRPYQASNCHVYHNHWLNDQHLFDWSFAPVDQWCPMVSGAH